MKAKKIKLIGLNGKPYTTYVLKSELWIFIPNWWR